MATSTIAICGAISVIGGAVAVLSGWYKSWKAPKEKQDNRIEQIEKRITNIETWDYVLRYTKGGSAGGGGTPTQPSGVSLVRWIPG